ncbi:hypothetical protein [[Mycoplasma] mobile]|uniref:hypothetical protein n=1 Tax=[Mycoplasma] mobile TaxID=2118 RepID=UPI00030D9FFE|nr:hypothetical protein [[Mycoplasma] mobile]
MKKFRKNLIDSSTAISALGIILVAVLACGTNTTTVPTTTQSTTQRISSTSIINGVLQPKFGAANDNGPLGAITPQISFKAVSGAVSYALVIIDNEATNVIGAPFVHWALANIKIAPDANGMINIPEDLAAQANSAIRESLTIGRNSGHRYFNDFSDFNDPFEGRNFWNSQIPNNFRLLNPNKWSSSDLSFVRTQSGYYSPFTPNAGHYYQISVLALDADVPEIQEGFALGHLYERIKTLNIKVLNRMHGDFFYNQVVPKSKIRGTGSEEFFLSWDNIIDWSFMHPENSPVTAPRLYSENIQTISNIKSTSVDANGNLFGKFLNDRKNGASGYGDWIVTTNSTIPNLSWNSINGANSYLVTISEYRNVFNQVYTNFVAVVPSAKNTVKGVVSLPSQLANLAPKNGIIYGLNNSTTEKTLGPKKKIFFEVLNLQLQIINILCHKNVLMQQLLWIFMLWIVIS